MNVQSIYAIYILMVQMQKYKAISTSIAQFTERQMMTFFKFMNAVVSHDEKFKFCKHNLSLALLTNIK